MLAGMLTAVLTDMLAASTVQGGFSSQEDIVGSLSCLVCKYAGGKQGGGGWRPPLAAKPGLRVESPPLLRQSICLL